MIVLVDLGFVNVLHMWINLECSTASVAAATESGQWPYVFSGRPNMEGANTDMNLVLFAPFSSSVTVSILLNHPQLVFTFIK